MHNKPFGDTRLDFEELANMTAKPSVKVRVVVRNLGGIVKRKSGYGPCMAEVYAAFCRVSWDMWTRAWIGWVLRGVRVRA